MTSTQTHIQDQLERKHEELQTMIVHQQEELRRVSEQLLMAKYGLLPSVASIPFDTVARDIDHRPTTITTMPCLPTSPHSIEIHGTCIQIPQQIDTQQKCHSQDNNSTNGSSTQNNNDIQTSYMQLDGIASRDLLSQHQQPPIQTTLTDISHQLHPHHMNQVTATQQQHHQLPHQHCESMQRPQLQRSYNLIPGPSTSELETVQYQIEGEPSQVMFASSTNTL